jgi:NAD(P)H-dependent FMN reductase
LALKLNIIIASTRPGRVGPSIAKWFHQAAEEHGKFAPELVDLADFNLPVYNEPEHPTRQLYQHAHTKAWAASVKSADAFVFVTPEYNFGPPPSLLNALNYVYLEWNYAPAGFVSYGGISGGMRAVQAEKLTLTTLKVMPILEGVIVPMVTQHLADGNFTPNDLHTASATAMLDELHRWADALRPLRSQRK